MALSRIKSDMIADDAITTAKIDDETIVAADVVAGQIMNAKISSGAGDKIAHTKTTVGTAATLNIGPGASTAVRLDATPKLPVVNGSALTNLTAANLVNALPALNGSALTSLSAGNLTGSFPTSPAISGAALTGIVTDFTPLTNQMARLALHIGAVESLAKFNMIDQVIDDYEDATGIVAYNGVGVGTVPIDSSSSAHTITAVNNATISTTVVKPGFGTHSIYFAAANDYISIPDSSDWDTLNSDFTIDFWIYSTNIHNTDRHFSFSTSNNSTYSTYVESNGNCGWIGSNAGGTTWTNSGYYAAAISANTWTHMALVKSGSGTDNVRMYIDGVYTSTGGATVTNSVPNINILTIGAKTQYLQDGFQGYMNEFRVSNSARWVANFTPETSPYSVDSNTKLLIHGGGAAAVANTGSSSSAELQGSAGAKYYEGQATTVAATPVFADASSSGHVITANNSAAATTAKYMVGTHSIDVVGSKNFTIPDHADWTPSGDFTYEFWMWPNGNQAAWSGLAHQYGGSRGLEIGFSNATTLYCEHSSKGGLTYAPGLSAWHHVAFVRDGNTGRLYVDGVERDTDATYTGSMNNPTGVMRFGGLLAATWNNNWSGYLDEIRFSNVCRYPNGTTFTAFGQDGGTIASPTPFTNDSDTVLLIHGEAGTAISGSDSMTLISTTTETVGTAPTKASIVLQTEDEVGTATINDDLKAGVSRDALNYIAAPLTKISTWGSGNVYAANDVTLGPGVVMDTKVVTTRSSKFHIDEVISQTTPTIPVYITGARSGTTPTVTPSPIINVGGNLRFGYHTNNSHLTLVDGSIPTQSSYGYTPWFQQTAAAGTAIRFQWSVARMVTEARWYQAGSIAAHAETPNGIWQWQGSNDASSWTDIGGTFTLGGGTAVCGIPDCQAISTHTTLNGNTNNYIYYQMLWVSGTPSGNPMLTEIEFKEGVGLTTYSNQQPTLELTEGYTYKFDTSDSTLSGHTFKFATAADAAGSTQYTTGVTESGTPGSANAYTQIVVAASAPVLYYYCSNHASMGGTANTPAEFLPLGKGAMRYKIETKNQSYTAAPTANVSTDSTGHTGTLKNGADFSTTQKKFGTKSFFCDGTDDYMIFADHSDFYIGTGDFTVEAWVYPASSSAQAYIIGTESWGGGSTYNWFLGMSGDYASGTSRVFQWSQYGGSPASSKDTHTITTYAPSAWYHVAVVRTGSTLKMFVNGIEQTYQSGGVQTGNWNLKGTDALKMGIEVGSAHDHKSGNQTWTGYIDELRISNSARYTTGFTPSTTAFTNDANTKFLMHMEEGVASGKVTRIHGTSLSWS